MSWKSKPLSSFVRRIGGGTPSRKIMSYWGGDLPWFTVADLSDDLTINVLERSRECITEVGLAASAANLIPANAVVCSTRVVVGKIGISRRPIATNQDFSSFVCSDELDPEFLAFYLLSKRSDLRQYQRGATIKGIRTEILDNLQVPTIDPAEQRRIVSRIKECLSRVAEMQRLREEIVADNEFLESSFVNDFLSSSTVRKAHFVPVGKVLKRAQYGTSQKADGDPSATPMLRMGNIRQGRVLATNGLKYVRLSPEDLQAYRLKEGDILFNRTNSFELVGKSGVFTGLRGDWVFASYLIRLIVNNELVIPEFVSTLINSSLGRSFIEGNARRAIGQVNINAKQIAAFEVPELSLIDQKVFVKTLTQIRQMSDQIAEELAETEFIHLRESILREAFTGNL